MGNNAKEIKEIESFIENEVLLSIENIMDIMQSKLSKFPESFYYSQKINKQSKTKLAQLTDRLYSDFVECYIICNFIIPICKRRLKNGKNKSV